MFLRKGALKICSKLLGEHPCRSVISIKLLRNFIEIALQHECFPANFLHIFRIPFYKSAYRGLFLYITKFYTMPIKPDQLNVVFHIETNYSIPDQMTGFYMKCNIWLNPANIYLSKVNNRSTRLKSMFKVNTKDTRRRSMTLF